MSQSRRDFLKKSAMAVAGAGLAPMVDGCATTKPVVVPPIKNFSPNDKISIGVIGCNGMGFSDVQSLLKVPGVQCIAVCDVDEGVLNKRASELVASTGVEVSAYGDYRALLDNKDVDAVVIGTPDHWHCLTMIEACQAGKDVYVEKPLANSIEECGLMIDAAKRYNRIVQVGQWQRSGPHWEEAVQFVRSGQLGRIRMVKAWAFMNWMGDIPVEPDGPAPDGVDYDMWLGPAPDRPFNPNRFHFNFRWYWDYAGGLMTDWGVHLIDIVLYAMDAKAPRSVLSAGGKFAYPDGAMQTPDTQQALYEFDDFSMVWEHAVGIGLGPFRRSHGVAFIGNNGTLVVDRGKWEIYPEPGSGASGPKMPEQPVREAREGEGGLDQHTRNFIDCMRSRNQTRCNAEVGALAAVNAHLGNIAFRTGRKVNWEAEKSRFTGDREATRLTQANYRRPWKVPQV